jgi:hypothetical protein
MQLMKEGKCSIFLPFATTACGALQCSMTLLYLTLIIRTIVAFSTFFIFRGQVGTLHSQ